MSKSQSINIKGKLIHLNESRVMGILNLTPNSFYDGGKYIQSINAACTQVETMLSEGADFIDIGAQSTKPGSEAISVDEELARLIPILENVLKRFPEAVISIDTNKALVARMAIEAGAHIINDISAGDDDLEMIPTIAELNVPYIFMHKKGIPQTMHLHPEYSNVVWEVFDYLNIKKQYLYSLGITDIIADIGFGFGKNIAHNFQLVKHAAAFEKLELPLLFGVSRKSMIYKKLGITANDALNGTSVIHSLLLSKMPGILRVHDVKEAKETIRLVNEFHQA